MNDTDISKFLSYVLRHRPDSIGIKLDKNGWVDIDALISASGKPITQEDIARVVESNNKKRFAISGNKIRANQGHTVEIDLQLKKAVPPPILYHGTSTEAVPNIFKKGLLKMERHHVHLSADIATAQIVAKRRKGSITILHISAFKMLSDKIEFFKSENGVWLTDYVDPKYITILSSQE